MFGLNSSSNSTSNTGKRLTLASDLDEFDIAASLKMQWRPDIVDYEVDKFRKIMALDGLSYDVMYHSLNVNLNHK